MVGSRSAAALLTVGLLIVTTNAAVALPFTATYTFTGSPGNQASEPVDAQPAGAALTDIIRGSGITPLAGANSINSDNWTTGGVIDPNDYYAFTITPAAGFQMDLTDLDFTERRSGTGILTLEVRSSLDAFASAIATINVPDDTLNRRQAIDLGAAFLDLVVPVEFRIFGYSAEGAAGSWRLGISSGDAGSTLPANLQLSGDLSAVAIPEPTSVVLLGAGMLVFSFSVAVVRVLRRGPK